MEIVDQINAEIERIAAGRVHGVFVAKDFIDQYTDEDRIMQVDQPHRVLYYRMTVKRDKYKRMDKKVEVPINEIYDMARSMFPHVFYLSEWSMDPTGKYRIIGKFGVIVFDDAPVATQLIDRAPQEFHVGTRILTGFGDEGVIVEAVPDQGVRVSLWISHANFPSYNITRI